MTELTDYPPQPPSWFSETVTYSGIGRIDFSSPRGWAEGLMTCEVSRIGETKVVLEIQSWNNSEEPNDPSSIASRDWLLSGFQLKSEGEGWGTQYSFSYSRDESVVSVNLRTSEGQLVSDSVIYYSWQPIKGIIVLHFDMATYQVSNQPKTNAKYWILPCINFKPENTFGIFAAHRYKELQEHPLIVLSNDITAISYVIPFEYDNKLAFIEPLPNYDQIAQELVSGQARLSVTSLMIGTYSSEDREMHPVNLLPILGLSTGRPVGASWIEYRDQNGRLVYRIHCNLGRYAYGRGREIVHDMTHNGGLRKLLTEASKSTFVSNPLVRTALRDVAEAISGHNLTIIFYYTFTAFDLLFKHYTAEKKLKILSLKSQLADPQVINDIKRILKVAETDIRNLKAQHSITDPKQADIIDLVAKQTTSIPLGQRDNFGDKVVELIRSSGLSDIEALSASINDWAKKVNDYRNDTMHVSHYKKIFDPETRKDFKHLTPHLIDILIRILLKTVGYTGSYGPFVSPAGSNQEIDWVKPTTPPSSLGYK